VEVLSQELISIDDLRRLTDDELAALKHACDEAVREIEQNAGTMVVEGKLSSNMGRIRADYFRDMDKITGDLEKGRIGVEEFDRRAHATIGKGFERAYAANRGAPLNDGDREYIRRATEAELGHARKFGRQIADGTTRMPRTRRVGMYAQTLDGIGWNAKIEAQPDDVRIGWKLGKAEHCLSCILLASQSPYTKWNLPTTPRAGATECLCITTPWSRVMCRRGLVPISEVKVGDEVFTHRDRWRKVTAVTRNKPNENHRRAVVEAINGEVVGCTSDHEFLTVDGWKTVEDISKGEFVAEIIVDEYISRFLEMRATVGPPCLGCHVMPDMAGPMYDCLRKQGDVLYDIEVEEDHSFVIEGLIAHNSNCKCKLTFTTGVLRGDELDDVDEYAARRDQSLRELAEGPEPPKGLRRPDEIERKYIDSLRNRINYQRRVVATAVDEDVIRKAASKRAALNKELIEFTEKNKIHEVPIWSVDDVIDERHIGRRAERELFRHGIDGRSLDLVQRKRLLSILDRYEDEFGSVFSEEAILKELD